LFNNQSRLASGSKATNPEDLYFSVKGLSWRNENFYAAVHAKKNVKAHPVLSGLDKEIVQ
jgi:hypothetical protein